MKSLVLFLSLFALICQATVHAQLLNIQPESVEAEAYTILDAATGQTIAEHNSQLARAPASLTKMMVAYIVLKDIQAGKLHKNEVITATPVVNTIMWDESQMYLKSGEQISVDRLLAGLIIMSANDAAVTLAERVSGSIPAFLARMNTEAQALGMQHTHFSNPQGITLVDHYSTAHDLALLASALVNQTPDYLYYSKQPSFQYQQHFHRATNLVLKDDPSVDGLKTGYTKAAGYNLALTANRLNASDGVPERRLIVVVLGAKSALKRAEVAHKLLNLAYTYTRNEQLIQNNQIIAELPVVKSTLKMFKVETHEPSIVTTSLYNAAPIQLNQFNMQHNRLEQLDQFGYSRPIEPLSNTNTRIQVQLNESKLTAPLMQVVNLATLQVYQNNQLIRSIPVQDHVQIQEANLFERFMMWLGTLFSAFHQSDDSIKIYPI